MPLRCLLFSSNEEMVQPIWQILTDLGIEGEYCRSAVDAVERVTTQLFQIVITDWEDQPEATFLLKTARDQKAAQRPLTLAIVSDDTSLPQALQAGANSVLVRPIRPEQVRDTMTTACELIRAKQSTPPQRPLETPIQSTAKGTAVMAAAAAAAVSSSAPATLPQETEKTFRAGEFLHSSSSAPGAQFDTECEVQKSIDKAVAAEVDALSELEPMAASVENAPAALPPPVEPRKALDGWASLQARLTKPDPPSSPSPAASPQNELLAYGEAQGSSVPTSPTENSKVPDRKLQKEAESEAVLFSYMGGEEPGAAVEARSRRSKIVLPVGLAVACLLLVGMPRTRRSLMSIYRNTTHAGRTWLNPQPVQVPPAVTQHESFGQEGDEYKLPVTATIPDATTDPSQIRVLAVIDPTAKPAKGSDAANGQASLEPNSSAVQTQSGSVEGAQEQVVEGQIKEPAASSPGDLTIASPEGAVAPVSPSNPPTQTATAPQERPRSAASPLQSSGPRGVPPGPDAAIPSSLKSQIASMTPDAGGAKPVEAALSSIEPVILPESAAWNLLAQPVDPLYPDAARGGGQKGSVVLQIVIGRDGTVQDAKFLQGSLVFARAAIDAVKQWRFKPYSMNGRAVSVQSVVTLNFKPPSQRNP